MLALRYGDLEDGAGALASVCALLREHDDEHDDVERDDARGESRRLRCGAEARAAANDHRYTARRVTIAPEPESTLYEEFHPYGTTSYRAMRTGLDAAANRFRFTGVEKDEETGLAQHGARYYAAWLGRWTAGDPIGVADGVNRFAYCGGSPTRMRDTEGTRAEPTEQQIAAKLQAEQVDSTPFYPPVSEVPRQSEDPLLVEKRRAQRGENPEIGHVTELESRDGSNTGYAIDDPLERLFWPPGLTEGAKLAPPGSGAYFVSTDGDYTEYFDELGQRIGRHLKQTGGPALEQSLPGELLLNLLAGGVVSLVRGPGLAALQALREGAAMARTAPKATAAVETSEHFIYLAEKTKGQAGGFGHVAVGVEEQGEFVFFFDQVIAERLTGGPVARFFRLLRGGQSTRLRISSVEGLEKAGFKISKRPISAAQASAARDAAYRLGGQGTELGPYNVLTNSCASTICDVFRAAGVRIPSLTLRPTAIARAFRKGR